MKIVDFLASILAELRTIEIIAIPQSIGVKIRFLEIYLFFPYLS